jgi:mono/diheme cytochrome c family protein
MPRILFTKLGVQMHAPVHDVQGPPPPPQPTGKPDVDEKALKEHAIANGRYVATIGACAECHSLTKKGPRKPEDPQYLSGSEGPMEGSFGKVWARNLTPDKETGIGKYWPDQIKQSIRTGVRLDGKRMAPPMSIMIPHYSGMAEEDLDAVVAYLKSVPPVRRPIPERELSPSMKAQLGEK